MKKSVFLILSIIFTVFFSGCPGNYYEYGEDVVLLTSHVDESKEYSSGEKIDFYAGFYCNDYDTKNYELSIGVKNRNTNSYLSSEITIYDKDFPEINRANTAYILSNAYPEKYKKNFEIDLLMPGEYFVVLEIKKYNENKVSSDSVSFYITVKE